LNGQTAKLTTPHLRRSILDTRARGSRGRTSGALDALGDSTSQQTLQFYSTPTRARTNQIGERRQTYDIDFHHTRDSPSGSRWCGSGLRNARPGSTTPFTLSFDPDHRDDLLASAFVEIGPPAGARPAEPSGPSSSTTVFTGFEFQPTCAASWNRRQDSMAGGRLEGGPGLRPRSRRTSRYNAAASRPWEGMSWSSLSQFRIRSPRSCWPTRPPEVPTKVSVLDRCGAFFKQLSSPGNAGGGRVRPEGSHFVSQQLFDNKGRCGILRNRADGFVQAFSRWRISGWYSTTCSTCGFPPSSTDTPTEEGTTPRHQIRLTSSLELPTEPSFERDAAHVAALEPPGCPGILRADVVLAWHPRPGLEFA